MVAAATGVKIIISDMSISKLLRFQSIWRLGLQRSSLTPLSAQTPTLRFMHSTSVSLAMTCLWWLACLWTKDTTNWSGEEVPVKEQCPVDFLLVELTEELYPCELGSNWQLQLNQMILSGMMQPSW